MEANSWCWSMSIQECQLSQKSAQREASMFCLHWMTYCPCSREIKSDNGPPLNGHKFAAFSEYMGFRHRTITPGGHRQMGWLRISWKILAKLFDRPVWTELIGGVEQVPRNYRGTPHVTNKVVPSVLFCGRNICSRLPVLVTHSKLDSNAKQALKNDAESKSKSAEYSDSRKRAQMTTFNIWAKSICATEEKE